MIEYTEKLTFRELLHTIIHTGALSKVIDVMYGSYYADHDAKTPGSSRDTIDIMYIDIVHELLELEPDDEYVNTYNIHITIYEDDLSEEGSYVHVGLLGQEDKLPAAIDLIPWNRLLNMKVSTDMNIDVYGLLAHMLWEITFYGKTSKDVDKEAATLLEASNDKSNLIEWTDIETDLRGK